MLKQIIFYIVTLLVTGAGSYIVKKCESDKDIKLLNDNILSLKQTIILKNDTLGFARDTISALKDKVSNLKQADSSNRFFIAAKENVLIEQRNIIRNQTAEIKALTAWKLDAQDGIIIQKDTIFLKKRGIFGLGKGYKIIK